MHIVGAVAALLAAALSPVDAGKYCSSCFDSGYALFSDDHSTLYQGQQLGDDGINIRMQPDSNFVLYVEGNVPKWATNTQGSGSTRVTMQPDGNLVMYTNDNVPTWASHTDNQGVGPFCLQRYLIITIDHRQFWNMYIFDSRCAVTWRQSGNALSTENATTDEAMAFVLANTSLVNQTKLSP
ncbi:Aste57867_8669 [Aphanomyces stellatus]|uniref:Aste57867_8669 protein n=1 Tax=Aphanomyces stellatus TaxID=120398 RepID=A0A485KKY9_9STRA|nr:hypothetical protein As57867_008635 [Aphanomyces stellatus]VFT85555.1 Aste57867_8669 [Aphanomyces stellatus]